MHPMLRISSLLNPIEETISIPTTTCESDVISLALLTVKCISPTHKIRETVSTKKRKLSIHTKSAICQTEGCRNRIVSRGHCVRHGGGSRCIITNCDNRAKLYKLCFRHGGVKTCEVTNCTRKAKQYGVCTSHGGGPVCRVNDCTKVSSQGGFCWAHGGGNRCRLQGCTRRSYQKLDYYCLSHAKKG